MSEQSGETNFLGMYGTCYNLAFIDENGMSFNKYGIEKKLE